MSIKAVEQYFRSRDMDMNILLFEDTSTVDKAADSLGVTPGEIAKSLLFKIKEGYVMVIMAGDKKINNRKFKDTFSCKAKMPDPGEVMTVTGHPVGGVCPFGIKEDIDIYLDESLKAYEIVYPAAGDVNAAVKISVEGFSQLLNHQWVDISQ